MSSVNAFLSHRAKDAMLALKLKSILEDLIPNGDLHVWVSESIVKGEEWYASIRDAIGMADRFLLLYTDPSQKWDWCLYESGYFSGARLAQEGLSARFITLHAADVEPPSPLSHWQTVRGNVEEITKLLVELYCRPIRDGVPPIAPLLEHKPRLLEAATQIAALFGPRPRPEWYTLFLKLRLTADQVEALKSTGRIPDDVLVQADERSLALFNRASGARTAWRDLRAAFVSHEREQVTELWCQSAAAALSAAAASAWRLPQLPLFYSHEGACYHSLLQRLDNLPDGGVHGYIVFSPFCEEDDPRPPGDLGTLSHMLTLGRSFRWGVIERYANEIERVRSLGAPSKEMVRRLLSDLESAIARAISEGTRANLLDPQNAVIVFPRQQDREQVRDLYARWYARRDTFRAAIEASNLPAIADILGEYRCINSRFMALTSKRFHELLSESDKALSAGPAQRRQRERATASS